MPCFSVGSDGRLGKGESLVCTISHTESSKHSAHNLDNVNVVSDNLILGCIETFYSAGQIYPSLYYGDFMLNIMPLILLVFDKHPKFILSTLIIVNIICI